MRINNVNARINSKSLNFQAIKIPKEQTLSCALEGMKNIARSEGQQNPHLTFVVNHLWVPHVSEGIDEKGLECFYFIGKDREGTGFWEIALGNLTTEKPLDKPPTEVRKSASQLEDEFFGHLHIVNGDVTRVDDEVARESINRFGKNN